MKIINLEVENVKRLSAVNINPSRDVVVIGGKNGAGKSSVLDSIMYAIAGGHSLPGRPLKDGTQDGHVTVDIGEFTITRKFHRKEDKTVSTSLEIKNASGFKASSPQALCDSFYGKMTFDPLEFSRLKPQQQAETLKSLVNLDFTDIDRLRDDLYSERAAVNKALNEKLAQLGVMKFEPNLGIEEVSISELMSGLSVAQNTNQENKNLRNNLEINKRFINEINDEICKLQAEICLLKERQAKATESIIILQEKTERAQDVDEEVIKESIKNAESTNQKIRQNAEYMRLTDEINILSDDKLSKTEKIKEIDEKKISLMSNAKFPVDGLGFDENGITMHDIPFDQCSSAEKLKISVAMGIALNPKLRIMQIRDGSLLDDDSMKIIHDISVQSDTQIWIERVGEGSECSIIIEDGHLKG